MSNEDRSSWPENIRAIHESRGMRFINEQQLRTFSTNILRMNGTELLMAAEKLHDEEIGLSLMYVNNKDAGSQAHRELKRYLHNFVASAMTLVDHTRVMLAELYGGEKVHDEILERIKSTVAASPVCKFVQDMRNYIVHKGLPNSEMYLEGTNTDDGFVFKAGVRIRTAELLNWDGWKSLSKSYLRNASEFIQIQEFTKQYLEEINAFTLWLEDRLVSHHSEDLLELQRLQLINQLPSSPGETSTLSVGSDESGTEEKPRIQQVVDGLAESLLEKITEFEMPSKGDSERDFKSQRPSLTLLDDDYLKNAVIRGHDVSDQAVVLFVHETGKSYGLREVELSLVQELHDEIANDHWVRSRFDHEFVLEAFISWSRYSWRSEVVESFYDYLYKRAEEEVVEYEVFYPIAQLEVEEPFEFGEVVIAPVSGEVFDKVESDLRPIAEGQQVGFDKLIGDLRSKYQGLAAVKVQMKVHPSFIHKASYVLAKDCVDLIRFFSPRSPNADARSPLALCGNEFVPVKKIIAISAAGFMNYEGGGDKFISYWQLSSRGVNELLAKGVAKAGQLLDAYSLNEFQRAVRSAMILYSKGCTMASDTDRLRYTILSAEKVYLRHSQEHAASCIAKRISNVVRFDDLDQEKVSGCISKSYFMRDDVESPSLLVKEALFIATLAIYNALLTALNNVEGFTTKSEFIDALECR